MGNGSYITISDGTITAASTTGAGIGGGSQMGNCSYIIISGGTVNATSEMCAGIGGSMGSSDIYISPKSGKAINARYSDSDAYTVYTEETNITDNATATAYFDSYEADM